MVAADARVDEARLLVVADDEDGMQLQRTAHVLDCRQETDTHRRDNVLDCRQETDTYRRDNVLNCRQETDTYRRGNVLDCRQETDTHSRGARPVAQLVERWTPGSESPGSRRSGARYIKLLTGMARLVRAAVASWSQLSGTGRVRL